MSVLNLTIYRLVWRRNTPLCLSVFTELGYESSCTKFSREYTVSTIYNVACKSTNYIAFHSFKDLLDLDLAL